MGKHPVQYAGVVDIEGAMFLVRDMFAVMKRGQEIGGHQRREQTRDHQ